MQKLSPFVKTVDVVIAETPAEILHGAVHGCGGQFWSVLDCFYTDSYLCMASRADCTVGKRKAIRIAPVVTNTNVKPSL